MAVPAVAAVAGKALKVAQLLGTAKRHKGGIGRILISTLIGLMALLGGFSSFMSQAIAKGEAQRVSGGGYWATPALRAVADDAAARSHTPAGILLAVAYLETSYGQHRTGPDLAGALESRLPADVVAEVDPAKLVDGGSTAVLVGGPLRPGDWINPQAVRAENAMGFMQFLPSTWRQYRATATSALGHSADPYAPGDAMTAAGIKIQHDLPTGGDRYSAYVSALDAYGGRGYGERVLAIAAIVVTRPGRAIACQAVMTQGYGPVAFGLEPALRGAGHYHTGIDLACPQATPVLSVTDGIAHTYTDGGWGNEVVVQTGTYHLRYCHLAVAEVADGTMVHVGDVIGLEGSTGASSGPHLHIELDQGPAAPADYQDAVPPFALLDPSTYSVAASVEGITRG